VATTRDAPQDSSQGDPQVSVGRLVPVAALKAAMLAGRRGGTRGGTGWGCCQSNRGVLS
jgi:hypothetical protein